MKINKRWRCQMYQNIRNHDIAGGGIIRSHGERASMMWNGRRAWDDSGERGGHSKGANYATMFAYLWRRFGPPIHGWDDHKELVNYYLTTPVEGVGFGLSCSPSFPIAGVFYVLSQKWVNRLRKWESRTQDAWLNGFSNHCLCEDLNLLQAIVAFAAGRDSRWYGYDFTATRPAFKAQVTRLVRDYISRMGPMPRRAHFEEYKPVNPFGTDWHHGAPLPVEKMPRGPHRTVLTAIEAGFRDLLRPVNIRDQYINICGSVDEDDDTYPCVSPSPRAGCGCSPDFIDAGDDWWDLAEAIRNMGVKKAKQILAPNLSKKGKTA